MPIRMNPLEKQLRLKINNKSVPVTVLKQIATLDIIDNLRYPAQFSIRINLGNDTAKIFNIADQLINKYFSPGWDIKISVMKGSKERLLLLGQIDSIGMNLGPKNTTNNYFLQVQGYDRSMFLCQGQHRHTYNDFRYSDIAAQVAASVGLSCVAHNSQQRFPSIVQANQTNWDFLWQLADRIGFELYVVENKLHFKRARSRGTVKLSWGKGLVEFNTRLLASHLSSEVTVQGWNPEDKEAIVATAKSSVPTSVLKMTTRGRRVKAAEQKTTLVVVDKALRSVDEANSMANAYASAVTRNATEAQCVVKPGNDRVMPGVTVSISGVGKHLSQDYYVSSVKHQFSMSDGYQTYFEAGNQILMQEKSTAAIGTEQPSGLSETTSVIGLVTDNEDPEGLGRVKIKYPWLDSDMESTWARVAVPMAGKERGTYFLPEVEDEVLVVFEHGDRNFPYVVGALWNGKDIPPETNYDGKNNRRLIKSRSGHVVLLDDTDGEEKIEIIDSSESNRIVIDVANNTITLDANDAVNINANKGRLSLNGNDIEIRSATNLTLSAVNIDIYADMELNLSGMNTKINGDVTTDVEGAQVSVKGSGLVDVKGNLVKIN